MLPAALDSSWLNLFWLPGPWSSTTCQSVPSGCLETCTRKVKCGLRRCSEEWCVWLSTLMGHKQSCNPGMALLDHGQTIRPTGPIGCLARPSGAPQPKTAKHQWHGCSFPDVIGLRCWDLHDLRQTLPQSNVVPVAKFLCRPWFHHPRHVIGPRCRTMDQHHDACTSCRRQILSRKVWWLMLFNSRFVLTKSGWPTGVPNCEGCLVVGCDHGPQAEVAQGVRA